MPTTSPKLTIDDLRTLTPVVFSTHPHPAVSKVYDFIPTLPIVEELLALGWSIRSAHQNKKGDPYACHRIVFDVPGAPSSYAVGNVHPTTTLFNSLNRTKRLSFCCGFFRTTCSNQAQISVLSHNVDRIHIIGWGRTSIHEMVAEALAEFGSMAKLFEAMKQHELRGADRTAFGKRALSIAYYFEDKFQHLYSEADAVMVLTPRRKEDEALDLFTTFNVAQENIVHAGSRGGVNEISRNRRLNVELWKLAQSYINV